VARSWRTASDTCARCAASVLVYAASHLDPFKTTLREQAFGGNINALNRFIWMYALCLSLLVENQS
jgi:hypothetical protein